MATTPHKWQKWSVPVLMGLNILFLGFLLWQQVAPQKSDFKGPRQKEGVKAFLSQELALDDTQVSEYETLIQIHQSENKKNHEKLRRLMDQQFEMISHASSEEEIALIAQEIGDTHANLIRANANHFASLRKILNPDQQSKLDGLLKEVMGNMGRPRRPGQKRRPPPRP